MVDKKQQFFHFCEEMEKELRKKVPGLSKLEVMAAIAYGLWEQKSGDAANTEQLAEAKHYRDAIAAVCEGWTLPDGARKMLETALWSKPMQQVAK